MNRNGREILLSNLVWRWVHIKCTFDHTVKEVLYMFKQNSDKKGVRQKKRIFMFTKCYFERQVTRLLEGTWVTVWKQKGDRELFMKWKLNLVQFRPVSLQIKVKFYKLINGSQKLKMTRKYDLSHACSCLVLLLKRTKAGCSMSLISFTRLQATGYIRCVP